MWKLTELPPPPGWSVYTGGDTWPGVIGGPDYRLNIEPALPPGKYRLQVRTLNVPGLEVTLGDSAKREVPLERNAFSAPVEIELLKPAGVLALRVVIPAGVEANPILQAVFITSDPREKIGKDDALTLAADAVATAHPAIPAPPVLTGNYLENASFEVGRGHGWGKFQNDQLDDSSAVDGRWSLRLPVVPLHIGSDVGWVFQVEKLETKFYRLPPGKYTVSGWLKADRACKTRGSLSLVGHPEKPTQTGPGLTLGTPIEFTTEWKRIAFTVDLPEVPGNFWSLQMAAQWRAIDYGFKFDTPLEELLKAESKDIPKTIWADAFQVERAPSASDYRARAGVEVGVRCDQPGHILYDTEPLEVELLVSNPLKRAGDFEVAWRVEDFRDQAVREDRLKIALKGETHLRRTIELPKLRGVFRLLVTGEADKTSVEELVYSVLPPNSHLHEFWAAGHTGSDTGFDARSLAVLKRANCNWMIHKTIGRMEHVQPRLGEFRWMDAEVQRAVEAKMMILGQVFINDAPAYILPYLPRAGRAPQTQPWDAERKKNFMAIWRAYVAAVVSHYKATIRHWEVTNEPYFNVTPEEHAEILHAASEAIREVDPGIHIIGFCSANMPQYFPAAVRAADPASYDGISGHFYEAVPQHLRFLASTLRKHGKIGWQTEAGPTFPSFYTTLPTLQQLTNAQHHANPSSVTYREKQTLIALQNELRCYGIGGIDHYFHYFSRFGNAWPSETTRRPGGGKEDVEYDGSLRPYAVARSIAAHLLDGAKWHAEWRGDPRVTLCLFGKGDAETVGFAWSNDGQLLRLAPGEPQRWRITDWLGNASDQIKSASSFAIDQFPRYFSVDAAPPQVMKLLDAATVSGLLQIDARVAAQSQESDGRPGLRLLLRNESHEPLAPALIFGGILGGNVGSIESLANLRLEPRETRLLSLPLRSIPSTRSLVISARVGDAQLQFPFDFAIGEAARVTGAEALETAPRHGFNFDLVRSGAGNRMSAADFEPSFQAGYDTAQLHLAAIVRDDALSPAKGTVAAERNDQIHFQIAAESDARRNSKAERERFARTRSEDDFTIVIAPTSDTTAIAEVRRRNAPPEPLSGARIVRSGDGYRLAVAVPWAAIGMRSPEPGDSCVFNVIAFDADGVNEDHKTEWPWAGGSEFEAGNPAGWGELIFR